jgi:hypothetical protein
VLAAAGVGLAGVRFWPKAFAAPPRTKEADAKMEGKGAKSDVLPLVIDDHAPPPPHTLAVAKERWPEGGVFYGHVVQVYALSPDQARARLDLLVEEGAISRQVARCINEMVESGVFERELSEEQAEAILDRVYRLR